MQNISLQKKISHFVAQTPLFGTTELIDVTLDSGSDGRFHSSRHRAQVIVDEDITLDFNLDVLASPTFTMGLCNLRTSEWICSGEQRDSQTRNLICSFSCLSYPRFTRRYRQRLRQWRSRRTVALPFHEQRWRSLGRFEHCRTDTLCAGNQDAQIFDDQKSDLSGIRSK